ncbi:MAG TPA: N-6 DNA methylase [Chitinophagaceae bacterium]|jgi:type I restriction-modification system DNA methylase subunit|nr:N-6 DNA methylase [Chitinophagaceae bacterium]HMU59051.1 N-6 DNA methylase [Chitinophagaceae bacterium]
MTIKEFYTDFDFTELQSLKGDKHTSELEELRKLGADKVYFSGDYPAILFKEVNIFDEASLKAIARTQHLCWNFRKVTFLFVLSKTEVRIYNCAKKPFNYEKNGIDIEQETNNLQIAQSDFSNIRTLQTIKELFSRVAVDCGLLWTTENKLRDKVSLHERIDKYLVKSLLNAARKLKEDNLQDDIIHCLLMRSIFLMYLEDKGAASETNLYNNILSGASSYLNILENKEATYSLFEKVEEHFNGNVFPLATGEKRAVNLKHLNTIRRCLFDGDISGSPSLFGDWRLFKFDVIQIELLSEIYEHFLEEFKENQKESAGQHYTPPSLVELILNDKLPTKSETQWKFKILDPACGSGIFLVESFKRLVKRWKNANPGEQINFATLKTIVQQNIFGIEYDRLAIRVTAFSLYLAMLEQLNPRTLWIDKRYRFPYLIYDPKDKTLANQGSNLFRQDSIGDVDAASFKEIDLVVGNPPFGADIELSSIKNYCIVQKFGHDMVIPFLHKAVDFSPKGSIALIFNTKVLTNSEGTFQNFRNWLFNENYVEKIYNFSIFRKPPKKFGGHLFSSAVGPVSVLFYQKNTPLKKCATIEYWAPKTYVKNNLIEGIIIDATDIKFLPRTECQKPDSKIWKIAMWGTLEDFYLVNRLKDSSVLTDFLEQNNFKKALGLQFMDNTTGKPKYGKDVSKLPYVRPENIQRYFTPGDNFSKLLDDVSQVSKLVYKKYYKISANTELRNIYHFRRLNEKQIFYAPHLVVKKGLSDKKPCASFIDKDCTFNSKVLGITGGSKQILQSISAIINSPLATYYLFLISSSIGIEREEIQTNELYNLPLIFDENIFQKLSKVYERLIAQIEANYPLEIDTSNFEEEFNSLVFELYSITQKDQILIEDFVKLSVDLLFNGYKSIALKPATLSENKNYANLIAKELNEYLGDNTDIVNASVFEIKTSTPLNIIRLSFEKRKQPLTTFDNEVYDKYLSLINKYTTGSLSKSIYIQKQIKYYDGNDIYIIKPNQKRFWSRSMAINDAKELVSEILKM